MVFRYITTLQSVARHVGRLKLGLKPTNFTLCLVSYRKAIKQPT